jgi:hypothetical protein
MEVPGPNEHQILDRSSRPFLAGASPDGERPHGQVETFLCS